MADSSAPCTQAEHPDQEHRSIISQLLARISHYEGTASYAEEEDIVKNTGAIAFEGTTLVNAS